MSSKFDDIMYRAGLTAQGCWDQMDEYDKTAIVTFAQLIVEECAGVAAEHDALDIYEKILDHFDEPQQDTAESAYDRLVAAGIIRPNERELTGNERDSIMECLLHIEPYMITNNQRYMTDHYDFGGMKYEVTYMEDDVYVLEIDPTWKAAK